MKNRVIVLAGIAAVLLMGWLATGEAAEKVLNYGAGILTAREPDGSVIISDRGYRMSPFVRIRDDKGRRLNFDDLQLPIKVYFEYEFELQGPVIKVISEVPQ